MYNKLMYFPWTRCPGVGREWQIGGAGVGAVDGPGVGAAEVLGGVGGAIEVPGVSSSVGSSHKLSIEALNR